MNQGFLGLVGFTGMVGEPHFFVILDAADRGAIGEKIVLSGKSILSRKSQGMVVGSIQMSEIYNTTIRVCCIIEKGSYVFTAQIKTIYRISGFPSLKGGIYMNKQKTF
jgi:hypothetical protein